MKKLFTIHDDFLEHLHSLLLRPTNYASTPEALEAYFMSMMNSWDIVFDTNFVKDFINFSAPKGGAAAPHTYMSIEELVDHITKFYDTHIVIRSVKALPDNKKLPARQGIEVLPADNPKQQKLGWVVRENIGSEVYLWIEDGPIPYRLKKYDDLEIGDKICLSWRSTFWSYEIKSRFEDGSLWAESSHEGHNGIGVTLHFNKDSRHCWVAVGFINLRGITKLEKLKKD